MANQSFSPTRLCGFSLGALACILTVSIAGVRMAHLINIVAAAATFGVSIPLLLAVSDGVFWRFVRACVTACFCKPIQPDAAVADLARIGKWCFLASGVFGTFVGQVRVLCDLSDMAVVGHGLAVSMLSVLYATFGALFLLLVEYSNRPRAQDSLKQS